MLELPEIHRLATQADKELKGRAIAGASRGNTAHKWLFFNLEEAAMSARLSGHVVRGARADGKWLHILTDGDALSFNEMGGQIRFHADDSSLPPKHHFAMRFADGAFLSLMVQGWGGVTVMPEVELGQHKYATKGLDPLSEEFSAARFKEAVTAWAEREKKPLKAMLVGPDVVAGLGNGYLHDILFFAGLLPSRKVAGLSGQELEALHGAIAKVMREAVALGGRDVERDLYGEPGGYVPTLDRRMADTPCPKCGKPIRKTTYLGGSCYVCSDCQR